MKGIKLNNSYGYTILGVLLVVVAVITSLGVWIFSANSEGIMNSKSATSVQAQTIITDGLALKAEYDRLMTRLPFRKGVATVFYIPNTSLIGNSNTANILEPNEGIVQPKVNPKSIKNNPIAAEGIWVFLMNNFKGNQLGITSSSFSDNEAAMVISGVKDSICNKINLSLHGSETIPPSTYAGAALTNGNKLSSPWKFGGADYVSPPGTEGWISGCFGSTSGVDNNFYFQVIQIN